MCRILQPGFKALALVSPHSSLPSLVCVLKSLCLVLSGLPVGLVQALKEQRGSLPCISVMCSLHSHCNADEIHELRKREKEQGLEPDWEIDMFMKASAARGKRHSIMTDYVMRMLGLEVCLHRLLACPRHRYSRAMQLERRLNPSCCPFNAVRLLQKYELAPESAGRHYVIPQHQQSLEKEELACCSMSFISLQVCADTMIGSQLVRGISGGQKKRVTTGQHFTLPLDVLCAPSLACLEPCADHLSAPFLALTHICVFRVTDPALVIWSHSALCTCRRDCGGPLQDAVHG